MMRKIALLSFLTIITATSVFAKDYTIDNVEIEARINADGTVRLTEARTYSFEEEFTWANYTIQKSGFTELTDISIRDGQGLYTHEDSEEPRTFQVTTNEQEINLKWFYQAEDETKTFTVEYTIHGALAVGPEWAEFFWNFIGDQWKTTTRSATVRSMLPRAVGSDSMHVWLRTLNESAAVTPREDGALITVERLKSNQSLKSRFLFPTPVLANPEITAPELTLTDVRADEAMYQKELEAELERKAHYASLGRYLTIIIAVLSLLIWVYFFRKYGVRHRIKGIPERLYSPPTSHPPATVGWLMQNRSVNGSHLVATLFDLARRGYFVLKEEEGEKKFLQKKKPRFRIELPEGAGTTETADLLDWEQDLFEYVTSVMEDGVVYFDQLTDQRSNMRKWFTGWAKVVKEDAKSHAWLDSESIKGAIIHGVLQGLLLAFSLLAIYWTGLFGLIAAFTTAVFIILSFVIVRRTESGEEVFRKWKAFKTGIKNGDRNRFSAENIDKMFVYAVALAVSEKHLGHWLTEASPRAHAIPWIVFSGASSDAAAVASSMATLAGTGMQSVSSVAGGSGATAGSAGGGTGGGAG
ncbi:MAG: DUF2207 domain-containing protein [Candidatus Marinimicrobia bacterium]|nr:DUF2207 domain-containing protein [Candidatus Neomarinimicrobiota bacterium]MCF7827916.1 DUF2207 domain-containing protein [Candidatus Neomarinimicrobiota bacterium]MCF7879329.1 DUF2207 domain-containing protein [Candidatus Neomarinimicrobiota bacterium]